MIVKAVLLFLVAMVVLGMFGKLRLPTLPRARGKNTSIEPAQKCRTCDSYVIGTDPCRRSDCPFRKTG